MNYSKLSQTDLLTYQLLEALSVFSKTQSVSLELSEKFENEEGPVRVYSFCDEFLEVDVPA
jgi:hypothetical protein